MTSAAVALPGKLDRDFPDPAIIIDSLVADRMKKIVTDSGLLGVGWYIHSIKELPESDRRAHSLVVTMGKVFENRVTVQFFVKHTIILAFVEDKLAEKSTPARLHEMISKIAQATQCEFSGKFKESALERRLFDRDFFESENFADELRGADVDPEEGRPKGTKNRQSSGGARTVLLRSGRFTREVPVITPPLRYQALQDDQKLLLFVLECFEPYSDWDGKSKLPSPGQVLAEAFGQRCNARNFKAWVGWLDREMHYIQCRNRIDAIPVLSDAGLKKLNELREQAKQKEE